MQVSMDDNVEYLLKYHYNLENSNDTDFYNNLLEDIL